MRIYKEQTKNILDMIDKHNNEKKKRLKFIYSTTTMVASLIIIIFGEIIMPNIVNGYDKDFRICIYNMYEGLESIIFYENLTGITLTKGEDLYGKARLNLKGNFYDITTNCKMI